MSFVCEALGARSEWSASTPRAPRPSGTAAEGVLRVLGVGYSSKDWEPLRAEPAGDLQDQDGGQGSSRLLSTQGLRPGDATSCLNPGTAPTLTSGS